MTASNSKLFQDRISQRATSRSVFLVIIWSAFAALLFALGFVPKLLKEHEANTYQIDLTNSVPVVKVISVSNKSKKTDLILPGDVQAIQAIPIFARASGYLSRRFFDIGDKVKKGDVLALIDTPELNQQVEQAEANLKTAVANLKAAKADKQSVVEQCASADALIAQGQSNLEFSNLELRRYQELAEEGAVSREQRDQMWRQKSSDSATILMSRQSKKSLYAQLESANAKIVAAENMVQGSDASLKQLRAMQSFQKVCAPCDGVITDRFVDAGSLVAAGGSSGTTQLMAMAKTDVLRIYVDVPQSEYRHVHVGDSVDLLLQEFPEKAFAAKVSNIAGGLTAATRTLQTEIRYDNSEHLLKPGAYAQVRFHYIDEKPPVTIPSNATITRDDGLYVAKVVNGSVEFARIKVAHDDGAHVDINKGVAAGDVLVLDAPANLAQGEQVSVAGQSSAGSLAGKKISKSRY